MSDKDMELAKEIIKKSKQTVNTAVSLGQVSGNDLIMNLLMLTIEDNISKALASRYKDGLKRAVEIAKQYDYTPNSHFARAQRDIVRAIQKEIEG